MNDELILIRPSALKQLIHECLTEHQQLTQSKQPARLYTKNQVAKQLGKSPSTIKKWVTEGVIKTNEIGLIPESEINKLQ